MPVAGWILLGIVLLLTLPLLWTFVRDKLGSRDAFYGDETNKQIKRDFDKRDESYEKSSLHMNTGKGTHLGNG